MIHFLIKSFKKKKPIANKWSGFVGSLLTYIDTLIRRVFSEPKQNSTFVLILIGYHQNPEMEKLITTLIEWQVGNKSLQVYLATLSLL